MNPDEEEPKDEGEPAPEERVEETAAPQLEPEIEAPLDDSQIEAALEPFVEEPTPEHEGEELRTFERELPTEREPFPELPVQKAPEPGSAEDYEQDDYEQDSAPEATEDYDAEDYEQDESAESEQPPGSVAPTLAQPAHEPPSSIHEAAAEELHEEPLAEIAPTYSQTRELESGAESVFEQEDYLFGEPEIPMPEPPPRPGDRQRRRDAKRNLDLDLGRIKRRKRYGLFITSISVLFIAFVLAPVTWVTAYLFFDPPANVLMMQRAAEGETIRHYPVPLNRMSPHIVRAVIAAEDANFCTHDGFDIEAIQDAMERNQRGGRTRGASTVSQQVAKNLFLWPERSWVRKGFETYFTSLIEFMWPKRRIMEAYLNTAEWGDGHFGIEAAARARFGVSAADLTPLQAARLAAVLPSPNRWRADNPGPYVRGRATSIAGRARVVRNERMAACVLALDRASN